ncbi:MAG: bifunctional deaminase-reductase domain protein [Frankiales bacterium]|nr:bifunctional deaminase-reductase domain protein [Frankiales bacterium]
MRRLLPGSGGDVMELDGPGLVEAYRAPDGRWLRVNFVGSLDGVVAVEGRSGPLGGPGDLRVFRLLRALADVVLVGWGTASSEGYRPVAPDSPVGRLRAELGRPAELPVAVVSRRASLAPGDLLGGAPTILITSEAADESRLRPLEDAGVTVLVCGEDDVDLPRALDLLAEHGLERITCEGGPQLLRAALAAGVVDELDLTIAPALVGAGTRLVGDAALPEVVCPRLTQVLEEDGVLFTRYTLSAPPA